MSSLLALTLAFFADLIVGTIFPTSGIAYNINPFKGVGTRNFLSCTTDSGEVDLWNQDDNSGRQEWVPYLIDATNNIYNIKVWDGVSTDKWFLSTTGSGDDVNLWNVDDGSGRQRWEFIQIATTASGLPIYNIQIAGGTGDRIYLSTVFDGTTVDLWHEDDGSGRQQWVLTPIDMDLIDVTFDIDDGTIVDETPTVINERYLCNDTPILQSQTYSVTSTITETATYTYEAGFTVSLTVEHSYGTPGVTSGTITLSVSTTHTWTTETSTEETTTQENNFPVNIPANSGVRAQAIVTEAILDVPYTATFQSLLTGQIATQSGMWEGVTYGTVFSNYDSVNLTTCHQN